MFNVCLEQWLSSGVSCPFASAVRDWLRILLKNQYKNCNSKNSTLNTVLLTHTHTQVKERLGGLIKYLLN